MYTMPVDMEINNLDRLFFIFFLQYQFLAIIKKITYIIVHVVRKSPRWILMISHS